MKVEGSSSSENKLWEHCFPRLHEQSVREGSYIIPCEETLLNNMTKNGGGHTTLERAFSRLDMALACVWPQVKYLFHTDLFPHRLAAATELLRAAQYGEGDKDQMGALGKEIAASLDAVEYLLAAEQSEQSVQAAEDPVHV